MLGSFEIIGKSRQSLFRKKKISYRNNTLNTKNELAILTIRQIVVLERKSLGGKFFILESMEVHLGLEK